MAGEGSGRDGRDEESPHGSKRFMIKEKKRKRADDVTAVIRAT